MASKKAKYGRYRSGLEKKFAESIPPRTMKYEPYSIPYTMHREYKPDFVFNDWLFVECKGFFRQGDTMKYKSIRDSLNEAELVFVLSDPNKKIRKGAKMTMGQWCDKEGLKFYTLPTVSELLDYAYAI
jgi:hypothetical protein